MVASDMLLVLDNVRGIVSLTIRGIVRLTMLVLLAGALTQQ